MTNQQDQSTRPATSQLTISTVTYVADGGRQYTVTKEQYDFASNALSEAMKQDEEHIRQVIWYLTGCQPDCIRPWNWEIYTILMAWARNQTVDSINSPLHESNHDDSGLQPRQVQACS